MTNNKNPNNAKVKEPSSERYDEKYRRPKFDLPALLGDFGYFLKHLVINPNTFYFLAIALIGLILFLESIPYIDLFSGMIHSLAGSLLSIPLIRQVLKAGIYLISVCLAIPLQLVVNGLEVVPFLARISPIWGERLYYKANRKRFEAPYSGNNAPSIIPKAYRWVRTASEKNHEFAMVVSLLFFGFNFWVCDRTFPVWDKTGRLVVQNAFFVGVLVFGVLGLLLISSVFAAMRLNRIEEAEFQAKQQELNRHS